MGIDPMFNKRTQKCGTCEKSETNLSEMIVLVKILQRCKIAGFHLLNMQPRQNLRIERFHKSTRDWRHANST